MATVTRYGVTPKTLTEYVDSLGVVWRTALGDDLSLATETPQGQLIDGLAVVLAEVDEAIVALANSFSLDRAMGVAQDDLISAMDVERRRATRSVVTVTIGGVPGTYIPSGSRVATSTNAVFFTIGDVFISSTSTVAVEMQSVDTGPIPATAGDLTTIIDIIAGWETATNPTDASLGRAEESQSELRLRYNRHVARNGLAMIQAIESRIWEVPGVTGVLIRDNSSGETLTIQGITIISGVIYTAVNGGTDEAVAQALYLAKPAGVPAVVTAQPHVNVAVPETDLQGNIVGTVPIEFDRVVPVPVAISVTMTPETGFPPDGIQQMRDGLISYVQSLRISQPVDSTRLLAPILAVPHHQTATVTAVRATTGEDAPPVFNAMGNYAVGSLVVAGKRDGASGDTVYRAVIDMAYILNPLPDPSTETDDTNWIEVGVTSLTDVYLNEKMTVLEAAISISIT